MAWKVGAARNLELVSTGSWDGDEARDEIFSWAGWPDDPDPSKARRGFLVYDDEAPELKGSYKLPFARVRDGRLVASEEGLMAARRRLPQTDIPEAVKDEAARVIDGYLEKKESRAARFLCRGFSGGIEIGEKEYRAVVSTGRIDRYDSIIYPDGVDFSSYLRHPVLLFNHDPDKVIGRVVDLQAADSGLEARFVFDTEDPDALRIKSKVDRGFIKGMSIGFLALEAHEERGIWHISRSELVEVSVVSVPANPDALIMNQLDFKKFVRLNKRIKQLERQLEQNAEELKKLASSIQLLKEADKEHKAMDLDKDELKRIFITELKNILGRA